jgi:putative restriction endonuclease
MFIEMSRDETHGGGSWAFPLCIWAPAEKKGGGSWPFWSKIRNVKVGDIILHLRGIPPAAAFVGYSTASTDGFETSEQPPDPGEWSYSSKFLRADLQDFIPFGHPINLREVFGVRRSPLNDYFDKNKTRRGSKLNLFYVRQSSRLQCLNGAYLSDMDEELFSTLFGIAPLDGQTLGPSVPVSVVTGQQLAIIQARQGQRVFSMKLKKLYGNACCFPSCSVTDSRFLVASHIARWSDNEKLRGHLGNGLCLCLMHDKAFEIGLFTVDKDLRVFTNPHAILLDSPFGDELKAAHGKSIRIASILPLNEALVEHWKRAKLQPPSGTAED